MVLIIVSRNIDLSVGSLLGFLGYVMAMVQTDAGSPSTWIGLERWYTWILALGSSASRWAPLVGAIQGFIVAYVESPRVHRHARRVPGLARPDLPLGDKQGQTLAPLDSTFQLDRWRAGGSLGEWKSWLVGAIACALIVVSTRGSPGAVASATTSRCVRCGSTSAFGVLGCLVVIAVDRPRGEQVHLADHRRIRPGSPTRSSSSSS